MSTMCPSAQGNDGSPRAASLHTTPHPANDAAADAANDDDGVVTPRLNPLLASTARDVADGADDDDATTIELARRHR